jgi:hypothetical protein
MSKHYLLHIGKRQLTETVMTGVSKAETKQKAIITIDIAGDQGCPNVV